MFAKLLKYEMKSTAGMLGLLSLAALGIGVVGGLMMRYMVTAGESQASQVLDGILSLMYVFIFLALLAYALGSELYLAVQFYKRKFTDEGYLTFTLPVRSWQIFLSSLINIMLWTVVITLVTVIAFAAIFLIGLVGTEVWERLLAESAMEETAEMFSGIDLGSPVHSVIEFVSGIVTMMSCITLGSVLAKKHKILGAIGVYYGYSLLLGAVSTWLLGMSLDPSAALDTQRMYLITSAINVVTAAGGFWLSCWLMEKKLNLP